MDFQILLNDLCNKLSCTQNDLASASGLSASVISRYLSGERTPAVNSEQITSLAHGLSTIAAKKDFSILEYSYEDILSKLNTALNLKSEQYQLFVNKFNNLIDCFDIKIKDLAKNTNYDSSFLYRIRSGERHPSNLASFCESISSYVADNYSKEEDLKKATFLLNCKIEDISEKNLYSEKILLYLSNSSVVESNSDSENEPEVSGFLHKMDDFNLDEYIEAIHFNDIKIPTLPIHLPISKYYYGIEDMRKGELDFFKTTVTSKSNEPVFMCADMPMSDMAEDMDFNKKWMFAIAATLRKGLHINIIHNLNRPFEEILLGLEAWIPIYMTGQVSPYHLEDYENKVFHELNYCSGSAALYGECIEGHHSEGRYYLTTNKHDLKYYHNKAESLLGIASPLMEIYNSSDENKYSRFLKENLEDTKSDRHIIATNLPLCTMPENILKDKISVLEKDIQNKIIDYYHLIKNSYTDILNTNKIIYDYHILSEDEFNDNSQSFSFPDLFITSTFEYSYSEYLEHVNATFDYCNQNSNFIFNNTSERTFKNIQITILQNQYFIVSKCKTPNIHFVIRHKKMLSAIENFYAIKKDI